jgi:glycosyltransferase involved in cell wall biosynthesis
LPIASGLPLVVTVLDLAPWESPRLYQGAPATRFGQRLRGQQLHDAAAIIVGTSAVARAARRVLHLRTERVHVVPMAPRPAFDPATRSDRADADRIGLPERYLVYPGRFDARHDIGTLFRALRSLSDGGRPVDLDGSTAWPPRTVLVGMTPEDRAAFARAAARDGIGELLAYAPALTPQRLAALVRGARAVVLPVVSDGTGLPAIESVAAGTPVVASSVGALPEIVGGAGLLVEPGEPDRLAVALRTIWADDEVHARVSGVAMAAAAGPRRTWADVARETREVYAAAGIR